jgi:hypothetical protein
MLFVLVGSRVTCVFFINECVIVYSGVILCCSCSLGAVRTTENNTCIDNYTLVYEENTCNTAHNEHEQHRMTPV